MPTTTTYEFGDIVLVPFPFSDINTSKKRPAVIVHSPRYEAEALVVSSDQYNVRCPDLILVIGITSTEAGRQFGSISIEHWKAANLLHPSTIKPAIATLVKDKVIKKLGRLAAEDRNNLRRMLTTILGASGE